MILKRDFKESYPASELNGSQPFAKTCSPRGSNAF